MFARTRLKLNRLILSRSALGSGVLAVLALCSGGDDAHARWSVLGGGGVTFPWTSDSFQAGLKPGPNVALGVGYRVSPGFELVGRVGHSRFSRDDDGIVEHSGILERPVRVLEISGGDMTQTDVYADVRLFPSQGAGRAATHPYLIASLGVAAHQYEKTEIRYQFIGHTWPATVTGSEDTNFAFGFGAGVKFDLNRRLGLVLEGRYQVILHAGTQLRSVPVRVELSFDL